VQTLGKTIGMRFTPDSHVTPILRWGRFDRVEGPGHFWLIPFLEETLPIITIGLQVGNFTFDEVLSQDNIPFTLNLTVLFQFDPNLPPPGVLAQIVRLSGPALHAIVKDYASQGLRRLVSAFDATTLCGNTVMSGIERDLSNFLRAQLRILGLVPLRQGGVLIKETIAPDKFKQTMLIAKQHQATLQMLANYRQELIEQAIRVEFITGLEEHKGHLTLFSSLDGMPLFNALDIHNRGDGNGNDRERSDKTRLGS
jgi:regulator of protease activity HflC (stomatin/prohibitin superfamily)